MVTQGWYQVIGSNNVLVPRYFFKVILDYREPETHAIGFILPNKTIQGNLEDFAIPVDRLEERTSLDFFPSLPYE